MDPTNPNYESGNGPDRTDARDDSTARVKQAGREAASRTKEELRSRLEHGKASAATAVGETTEALDQASARWAEGGHETLAEAASAMSAKLAKLADYVETHSLDEVTRDARRVARENPALMIAGGVALGLALSRFFKASAAHGHGAEAEPDTAARRSQSPAGAATAGAESDEYIPGRGVRSSDTTMPH
jgi:hypothetical protein